MEKLIHNNKRLNIEVYDYFNGGVEANYISERCH